MKSYKEFWLEIKRKVLLFKEIDDEKVVFGANTRGSGHKYHQFPVMTSAEIETIEKKKNITLPQEFRDYLSYFGAGGAGPDYGVEDLRDTFEKTEFNEPFKLTGDIDDIHDVLDDIEDFSGLLYLGTAGCCSDYYIELLGEETGRVWCSMGDGGTLLIGTMCSFYTRWIDKIETNLMRHQKFKAFEKRFNNPTPGQSQIKVEEIAEDLGCQYWEEGHRDLPEGFKLIVFERTPGTVIINKNKEITGFDYQRYFYHQI